MSAPRPSTTFATMWCVHGAALIFLAAIMPLMATTSAEPDWAESMDLVGAGALVAPTRELLALVGGWWPAMAGLGLLSLAGGLLWRWRGAAAGRWPLHLAAAAHVVLGALATWATHHLAGSLGVGAVEEAVGLVLLAAVAGWSSWHVERMHSTATAAPD